MSCAYCTDRSNGQCTVCGRKAVARRPTLHGITTTKLRALLADPDGTAIAEDMMRESQARGELRRHVSAAHFAWEMSGTKTPTEADRTLYVVDRHTTFESYPIVDAPTDLEKKYPEWAETRRRRYGDWTFWFPHAHPIAILHSAARWVRVVTADGDYRPRDCEALVVRRKRRDVYYVDTRCGVAVCVCKTDLFSQR